MKNKFMIAISVLCVLVAGSAAGYWLAMHRMSVDSATQPSVVTTMAALKANTANPANTEKTGKKLLYYYDPMYPQQKFDKPGKSPFMDMELVPVYNDDSDEGIAGSNNAVKISSRTVQNLGIRVTEVINGVIDKKVNVVGAVAFDERAVTVVQARVSGYIEKLFVRAPLDPVTKGQPLAEILAPEWVAAQEEYLALRRSPQANDTLRQAARQRLILLGMAESTVAAIEAEGKARPRIVLLSPISGVVVELGAREGMTIMPGLMLFKINGLANVWVNADVPETQAAWLHSGSAIEALVPAYPDEIFKGRVVALLPEVNAGTRTLKARINVANPRGRLVPGMYATISVVSASGSEVLLVPSEAVIQTGKRCVVIVATTATGGRQQFTPTDVSIGVEVNGKTEIRSGLSAGMKVVVSGQFMIDSEASLKSTGNRMTETEAPKMSDHDGMTK